MKIMIEHKSFGWVGDIFCSVFVVNFVALSYRERAPFLSGRSIVSLNKIGNIEFLKRVVFRFYA